MPLIQVSIIEGRSAEQKETLIRRLTEVACEVLDSQPGQVRVIITEVKPEHWGIGGESVRAKRLRDGQGEPIVWLKTNTAYRIQAVMGYTRNAVQMNRPMLVAIPMLNSESRHHCLRCSRRKQAWDAPRMSPTAAPSSPASPHGRLLNGS